MIIVVCSCVELEPRHSVFISGLMELRYINLMHLALFHFIFFKQFTVAKNRLGLDQENAVCALILATLPEYDLSGQNMVHFKYCRFIAFKNRSILFVLMSSRF